MSVYHALLFSWATIHCVPVFVYIIFLLPLSTVVIVLNYAINQTLSKAYITKQYALNQCASTTTSNMGSPKSNVASKSSSKRSMRLTSRQHSQPKSDPDSPTKGTSTSVSSPQSNASSKPAQTASQPPSERSTPKVPATSAPSTVSSLDLARRPSVRRPKSLQVEGESSNTPLLFDDDLAFPSPSDHTAGGTVREVPTKKDLHNTEDGITIQYRNKTIWPSAFGSPDTLPISINNCFPDSGEHWFLSTDEHDTTHPLHGSKLALYSGPPFKKPLSRWTGDERHDFLQYLWDHCGWKEGLRDSNPDIHVNFPMFEATSWAEDEWQRRLRDKQWWYWAKHQVPQGLELRPRTALPRTEIQGARERDETDVQLLIARLADVELNLQRDVVQGRRLMEGSCGSSEDGVDGSNYGSDHDQDEEDGAGDDEVAGRPSTASTNMSLNPPAALHAPRQSIDSRPTTPAGQGQSAPIAECRVIGKSPALKKLKGKLPFKSDKGSGAAVTGKAGAKKGKGKWLF